MASVADAARNNAELCAIVAGTGSFATDAWTSPVRTPPLHPDAVTLVPGVDAAALLARVDSGPGSSVKDSFADLDLVPFGFQVLFDAQWIARPGADAAFDVPALPPGVLYEVGGEGWSARLNRSDGCVGVSNVVTDDGGDVDATWEHVIAAAGSSCPGLPVVGYERDDDLTAALRHGFAVLGPLRVWVR